MAIPLAALYTDLIDDLSVHLPLLSGHTRESIKDVEEWPDIAPKQYACLALAKSFLKKYQDDVRGSEADNNALEKFLLANDRCRDWQLDVHDDLDWMLVGTFREEVYRFFVPSWDTCILGSADSVLSASDLVGPGAAVGAVGTDFFTKLYDSKLSATNKGLLTLYEYHISKNPTWADAENQRSHSRGGLDVVEGNKLSFVPKNVDTSRVICTEPSLNMVVQKGIGNIIAKRLRSVFNIDLAHQQVINRELARIGSTDGSLATIDLSSASDSISRKMVAEFLPADVVRWLDFARSPKVTLPDGSVRELHMVSSMGNGFTFPLQTALFSCVVSSVFKVTDGSLDNLQRSRVRLTPRDTLLGGNSVGNPCSVTRAGNYGVFGDDIIVPTRLYRKVIRLLNILGFQVNEEKSFYDGCFRESCGGDFFRGFPVRGVFVKTLQTPGSRYVAINRLIEWAARTGIALPRTVTRLRKKVRWLPVPLAETDDAGIRVPFSCLSPKDTRRNTQQQSVLYRRWASAPFLMRICDGDVINVPAGQKKRYYNASGLLMTFLRGDIDGGTGRTGSKPSLAIRLDRPKYHAKWASTPYWDWVPGHGFETAESTLRRLTTAAVGSLGFDA